jgi:hypothetical protein
VRRYAKSIIKTISTGRWERRLSRGGWAVLKLMIAKQIPSLFVAGFNMKTKAGFN